MISRVSDKLINLISYHIDEEGVDFEVGVLLGVTDDAGLHNAAATFHLQARRGHTSHLETLQVTQSPRQDLSKVKGQLGCKKISTP